MEIPVPEVLGPRLQEEAPGSQDVPMPSLADPPQPAWMRAWGRLLVKLVMWLSMTRQNLAMLAVTRRALPATEMKKKKGLPELTEEQRQCPHPPSKVKRGANQWCEWTKRGVCLARLSYQSKSGKQRRHDKDDVKPKASESPGPAASRTAGASTSQEPTAVEVGAAVGQAVVTAMRPMMESLLASQSQMAAMLVEAQAQTRLQMESIQATVTSTARNSSRVVVPVNMSRKAALITKGKRGTPARLGSSSLTTVSETEDDQSEFTLLERSRA